jgi:hypothetical protein
MTEQELLRSLARLYWLTAAYAAIGFVWYFSVADGREAAGFVLGALASFGNLWLFAWLSRAIAPGESSRKPWPASLYAGRFLVLFFIGYVIVKLLDVNPLAVILGLLVSTAAVLTSIAVQLIQSFWRDQPTR